METGSYRRGVLSIPGNIGIWQKRNILRLRQIPFDFLLKTIPTSDMLYLNDRFAAVC